MPASVKFDEMYAVISNIHLREIGLLQSAYRGRELMPFKSIVGQILPTDQKR
jgi:hypothetical protein